MEKEQQNQPTKKKQTSFYVITALCASWLIMGLLGIITPSTGLLWTPDNAERCVAANLVTGYIMVASSFTYLAYIAFCGKFDFSKKTKTILIASSIGVMVLADVLYFIIFGSQLDILKSSMLAKFMYAELPDNITFTIGLFATELGLLSLNISPLFVNSKKFGNFLQSKKGKTVIGILYFMFTWGIFIAIGIVITLIVIAIVIAIILIVAELYTPTPHPTYEISVDGFSRTLTYDSYDNGHDRYKDDVGGYWITDDNGKTFRRDN